MSGSREAFEAWASMNVGQPDFGGYHTDGGKWFYRHNFIRMCWEAWQAALAAQQKAEPVAWRYGHSGSQWEFTSNQPRSVPSGWDCEPLYAAPPIEQKAEPVAFMFVTRDRKRGQRSEFAAIDWSCPVGEDIEVIDKRPLVYAAPPLDPEGLRLLLEARSSVEYWTPDESNATESERPKLNEWYRLRDAIDAYLAKYDHAAGG